MASIGSSSLGELYSKCVQMVNENKISTKNAFELPLIEHMDDIVDSFMGGKKAPKKEKEKVRKSSATAEEAEMESRFHEASCTIEASARIYACRVDCVHTDTYRVLGGLNSADVANEEDGPPGEDGKPVKKRRICGVNTLEKNEANLVQQNIEADEQSDPIFRRMAAAFDAGGAKGLLLSHLPLAEDMSLVFNGDVKLSKAQSSAESIFKVSTSSISADSIGLGEPATATSKIEESRLCPELDSFRRQLWGDSSFTMPKALEDLLGVAVLSGPGTSEALAACTQPQAAVMENEDFAPPDMADGMAEFSDAADVADVGSGASAMAASPPKGREKPLPLVDMLASQVLAAPASSKDDVVAFDELFEKFCGAGGSNQFAYFDECWSKLARDKGKTSGALADAEGALAEVKEPKERQSKRPLFGTYMTIFLVGKQEVTALTVAEERAAVVEAYPGWYETQKFTMQVRSNLLASKAADPNFAPGNLSFHAATSVVEEIGERYGRGQDAECRDLKRSLTNIEHASTGRVLLKDFYGSALKGNWQFSESIAYLRELGALDESDPSNLAVLIPNYVNSHSNCVASSSVYSVCCINECEGLLSHLEREVAAPQVEPDRLLAIVSDLPSASVKAPRTLSPELKDRLHEVAKKHNGKVPLHGRLFAQWLHHAYPRECPFPHIAGKTNPMTADEWMQNRHESVSASKQDMLKVVQSTTSTPAQQELPWNNHEELVSPEKSGDDSWSLRRLFFVIFALCGLVAFARESHRKVYLLKRGGELLPYYKEHAY